MMGYDPDFAHFSARSAHFSGSSFTHAVSRSTAA
jgi:hypothetical protein